MSSCAKVCKIARLLIDIRPDSMRWRNLCGPTILKQLPNRLVFHPNRSNAPLAGLENQERSYSSTHAVLSISPKELRTVLLSLILRLLRGISVTKALDRP